MRTPTLVRTAAGVAAAAAVGSRATTANLDWYRTLDKPAWRPPQAAFPAVWGTLYGLIALATARALDRMPPTERGRFWRTYGVNLALNAGWTGVFFGAHRPRLALLEIAALNASNLALVPYVAWTGFATVLNSSIVARNRDKSRNQ